MIFTVAVAGARAQADDPVLPYTLRTQGFDGWSSTIRGDMRTLGMAGAMVGLADSYVGTLDNPAGLAMTMNRSGLQLSRNSISDAAIQDATRAISSSGFHAVVRPYPWGFSAGFTSPHGEGTRYRLASSGNPVEAEVYTREYRVAVARAFLENKLSVGAGLTVGQAFRSAGTFSSSDAALSGVLGVMVQLPRRWMIGASFHLPMTYHPDSKASPGSPVTNFNQPVYKPYQFAVGSSWIPNRFFRVAGGLYLIGPRAGAALLRDDSVSVGHKMTLQPRLGFTYTIADYAEFDAYLSAGAYYEMSRIEGQSPRFHQTTALEAYPWIFNFGTGIDVAPGYRNYLISFGVDVAKVMRKLDLIPEQWNPPPKGMLPPPDKLNDEGLPRPLVRHWRQRGPKTNIIDVGKELPGKLQNRLEATGDSIQELGSEVIDGVQAIPGAIGDALSDRIRKAREEERRKLEEAEQKPAKRKKPAPSKKKTPKKKKKSAPQKPAERSR